MSLTHATIEPDGTPNFHFAAGPVDYEAAKRSRFSDDDFGRRTYGRPQGYRYDPESELRDPAIQQKRTGLR